MKYRLLLVLGLVLSGLVFGLGSAQTDHAATAVQLTTTDRSNLQAVLNLTKVALDAIQVQVNHNAVQNPAAMIVTLNGIKSYLAGINEMLGGSPVAAAPVSGPATPVVTTAQPAAPQAVTANQAQPAGSAQAGVAAPSQQQTASVSSAATSKWAFWIVLIVAVVLAIVLAMPRKKSKPMTTQPTPSASASEEPDPIQSA